jgi:hypothetical protein
VKVGAVKVGAVYFGKQPAPVADINEDELDVHQPKKEPPASRW